MYVLFTLYSNAAVALSHTGEHRQTLHVTVENEDNQHLDVKILIIPNADNLEKVAEQDVVV